MKIQDVKDWLEAIRKVAWDDEKAHLAEDDLRASVLGAVADGNAEGPREMARLALTSGEIDFARWCA